MGAFSTRVKSAVGAALLGLCIGALASPQAALAAGPLSRPGVWTFFQDPANPAWSAQATFAAPVRMGVEVHLLLRCEGKDVNMSMGVGGIDYTRLPDPRRTTIYNYTRTLFIDRPLVKVMKGGKQTASITWSSDEGGNARINPQQMATILAADALEIHGGPQVVRASNANLQPALAGVIRQCRMRLPR